MSEIMSYGLLAVSCCLLAVSFWLLAISCWRLAVGGWTDVKRKQLNTYWLKAIKQKPTAKSQQLKANRQLPTANCQLLIALSLLLLTSCTSVPLREARNEFYSYEPQKAVATLSQVKKVSSRDQLLLYMEKGLMLHHVGKYRESIEELLKASKLMEKQDVLRVGQQSASFVINDWITEYKGEYNERLWVHTYLMMNYLLLYKYEDALVEAKQSLRMLGDHAEPLEHDYFTRALIALCFENLGEMNDAYIEYKKLAQTLPDPAPVAGPLYRLGKRLGFHKEAASYKKRIPPPLIPVFTENKPHAELIIFAGIGKGPVKISGNIILPKSIRFAFPQYQERSTGTDAISVLDSGNRYLHTTSVSTDINVLAKASLQYRAARVIAKETARAATKEAISRAVERKNEEWIGILLRAAFFLLEEPDTRCWQTLPARMRLIRVFVEPGPRRIQMILPQKNGTLIEEIKSDAAPGQRIYHSIRVTD